MFKGCSIGNSRVLKETLRDFEGNYRGEEISNMFQGSFKICKEHFKVVSRKFH